MRKLVNKTFMAATDPFRVQSPTTREGELNVSPFTVFNKMPNGAHTIKLIMRAFYGLFIHTFKSKMDSGEINRTLRRNWVRYSINGRPDHNFLISAKYLAQTLTREHRQLLADFTHTLNAAGRVRRFLHPYADADKKELDKSIRAPLVLARITAEQNDEAIRSDSPARPNFFENLALC